MNALLWRHKKRGSTYVALGEFELQSTAGPVPEGASLVGYMGTDDGKAWSREVSEFNDGRFEALPPSEGGPAVLAMARMIVNLAADAGFVVTIEQRPVPPLAMGRFETVASVRPARSES